MTLKVIDNCKNAKFGLLVKSYFIDFVFNSTIKNQVIITKDKINNFYLQQIFGCELTSFELLELNKTKLANWKVGIENA